MNADNGKPSGPSRPLKLAWLCAAAFFFVLAVVGLVIPGLPTTPFLLLTSYFLARSFPKLNEKLLKSRLFGPILTDWQKRGGVRRDVQIRATSLVLIVVAISLFASQPGLWLSVAIVISAAIGVGVIWQLPTIRPDEEDS